MKDYSIPAVVIFIFFILLSCFTIKVQRESIGMYNDMEHMRIALKKQRYLLDSLTQANVDHINGHCKVIKATVK